MVDGEPFPTGADETRDDRRLAKRVLGCFGLGGLGVIGAIVAVMVLIGALGSMASGCDLDFGDPGDGKDSKRLAVGVAPRTRLGDGTTVRVTSSAFPANEVVGIAVCLRTADTERKGVDACDENQGARYATDRSGKLDATFPVPRVITVGAKAYDCAAKPERCVVVAADASDYDESGGQTISFRSGLPAADLTPVTTRPVSDHLPIGADPTVEGGPVAPKAQFEVLASGFQPNEPLLIAYCTSEVEEAGLIESCQPLDVNLAIGAIMIRSVDGDFPRADASGAFTTTLGAQPTVRPYGSDLGEALSDLGSSTTTTSTGGTSTTAARLEEGEVRCTEATGGCTIVIAAAADTKRSAILPYVVAG